MDSLYSLDYPWSSLCEKEIIDCIQIIRNMCIKREKKQHMKEVGERKNIHQQYRRENKYNVCL